MYDVEYINSGRYLCTQYGIIISSFNTLLFSCKVLGSCELLFQGITSWMNVRVATFRFRKTSHKARHLFSLTHTSLRNCNLLSHESFYG